MTTALIIGAGPGLGSALARRCAQGGMNVALAARDSERLEQLAADLKSRGAPAVSAHACDVTQESGVRALFKQVQAEYGPPRLVIYNAGIYQPASFLETTAETFQQNWQVNCLGGFLAGQQTVEAMLTGEPAADGSRGTLLFTGATASLRGGAGFHNLAVGKFGLRALAQSMAREFGPRGIHVAHVVIDGQITPEGNDSALTPAAIAENYWHLYNQPAGAWTLELDLRPHDESF